MKGEDLVAAPCGDATFTGATLPFSGGGVSPGGVAAAMDAPRRGPQRRLQHLDGALDDRARAGRDDLAAHHGKDKPFRWVSDDPFEHDVQRRVPDVEQIQARARLRGDDALEEILDEVVPWVTAAVAEGRIVDLDR